MAKAAAYGGSWAHDYDDIFERKWSFRMTPWRAIGLAIVGVMLFAAIYRLLFGLGAATNLNDRWPWGLWIGFDVLTGVALAGGGFTTCFLVHVLHIKDWKPIARATALTSLIGYLLVLGGLFLDIGRWYNFWRPFLVYAGSWHSVLFEVFWCVSLYTMVQLLEFGHVVFERVKSPGFKRFFDAILVPMYIFGIILPTLHQSSLGSLYLVAVNRLDPLWWSILIPVFFLLSAVFVGPAMATVEGALAATAYRREFELDVLQSFVRVSAVVMSVYLLLKGIDLVYRGQIGHLFDGSFTSNMFLLEIVGGVIIPLIMYLSPSVRRSKAGLITASALVVAGVIFNRFNVVFTGMAKWANFHYFPSWMELSVSIGLVTLGILAYCFVVENFPVLYDEHRHQYVPVR
ncbi:NrfD/PsrC family molybdoenzyme membrane anchor subunit [Ammonifex thiophilus]|uniref:Ni/Fe-hydrogenase cytochrome b subunit n=1 Tax=Ammonifex thiophilus TaxID=444093 RepID=A0A3D8P2J6_9THEO|nr:Ni/Fe-hydrogenase cytochrome b subunit [Ammonifex thiophilus]RDV80502.1 Ni/Fe-hydrogenase cytochrome b subunit [Ammonifex thiophilus]